MTLGWFTEGARGAADRRLADLAARLAADGVALAGAVQTNTGGTGDCACDMDMRVLGAPDAVPVRISQSLGPGATGCRLDAGGLETAAAAVLAHLEAATPALVILAKFGRQEGFGRGFRPVVADALDRGLPVLIHVPADQRAAFDAFTGGYGTELAPAQVADWARRVAAGQAAA